MDTPVALVIFRRPSHTQQVLEVLAEIRPKRIYVISDGPSQGNEDEALLVQECRELIDLIQWDCEVLKNYSERNMGSRRRVVSGLDWVFETEDRAIILEDDCVPEVSFFKFCEELLKEFEHEPRVAGIGGSNVLEEKTESLVSDYFFSSYPAIWGWATWRRTWSTYSQNLPKTAVKEVSAHRQFSPSRSNLAYWRGKFGDVSKGLVDAWDYQLAYLCMKSEQLWVIPRNNLISNIGFGAGATHTFDTASVFSRIRVTAASFPLEGPSEIKADPLYDAALQERLHNESALRRLLIKIFRILPSSLKAMARKILYRNGKQNHD